MSRSSLSPFTLFAVLALWVFNAVACGARSQLHPGGRGGDDAAGPGPGVGVGGSDSGGAPAGMAGAGGTGGQIMVVGGGGGTPECVVFDSAAALAPLDVFFMLDSSGSMLFEAQGNQTKWDVIIDAFDTFANDPDSAALGVGLSFFPIIDNSYTQSCLVNGGPGFNCEPGQCDPFNVCAPSFQVACETDQDCVDEGFPSDTCEPYGFCGGTPNLGACATTQGCSDPNVACEPVGSCWSYYTCPSPPYEQTVFGVSKLPGAANGLVNTIANKVPVGGTPTLPALTGAIDGAQSFAAANPSHNVIVILATDGTPTVCDPVLFGDDDTMAAINNVANVAAAGLALEIPTFVIGVFGPEDVAEAQTNLDTIAQAGAGQPAYVISTGNNQSTQALIQALNDIRENAKSCEFELVEGDDPIDYASVWVRIQEGDMEEVWVKRVDGPAACDPVTGGFYYDTPISGGQKPSRIILCPATCALIDEAAENPTVEVFTSCPDPMNEGGGGGG